MLVLVKDALSGCSVLRDELLVSSDALGIAAEDGEKGLEEYGPIRILNIKC